MIGKTIALLNGAGNSSALMTVPCNAFNLTIVEDDPSAMRATISGVTLVSSPDSCCLMTKVLVTLEAAIDLLLPIKLFGKMLHTISPVTVCSANSFPEAVLV